MITPFCLDPDRLLSMQSSAEPSTVRAMGLEGEIGVVDVGAAADLIGVPDSRPLDDITTLQRPSFAMQSGRVVRLDERVYL